MKCPLDEEMTDTWMEDFLYPEKKLEASGRCMIDFDYLHQELDKQYVTLTLLHEEYVRKSQEQRKLSDIHRTLS